MAWWNLTFTPKTIQKGRHMKDLVENILSEEGARSHHSAQGQMLPALIEACQAVGRSYTIRAVAVEGRIAGYQFTTKPEDQVSGAQISAGIIDGTAYVMMTRDEIIADSQEHRGGLIEISNALFAACAELGIEIPITEGGNAVAMGANMATAIKQMAEQLKFANQQLEAEVEWNS